jgi:hypothetical protein
MDKKFNTITNNEIPLIVKCEINKQKIKLNEKNEFNNTNNFDRIWKQIENNNNKIFMIDKKFLNYNETAIICRLRSEHIELNEYLYRFNQYNHERCEKCNGNKIENIQHFLLECSNYNSIRNVMFEEIKKESIIFIGNPDTNINYHEIMAYLYPHLYQDNIYDIISINERIHIYKCVYKYIIKTERFKNNNNNNLKYNIYQNMYSKKENILIDDKIKYYDDLLNSYNINYNNEIMNEEYENYYDHYGYSVNDCEYNYNIDFDQEDSDPDAFFNEYMND